MIYFVTLLYILLATPLLIVLAKRRRFLTLTIYSVGFIAIGTLIPFTGVINSLNFQLYFNKLCGGAETATLLSNVFSIVVSLFLIISAITLIAFADKISIFIEIKFNKVNVKVKYFIHEYTFKVNTYTSNSRLRLARLNC